MTQRTPAFITFTGADVHTNVPAMRALSALYPIEWGILFSPSRQGVDPRYPDPEALPSIMRRGLRLSAHLCGDYSNAIMTGRPCLVPVRLDLFNRIQVNHRSPDIKRIAAFSAHLSVDCIAQCRSDTFPEDTSVYWLFDKSGGRGTSPDAWPAHPEHLAPMRGYAGGINPTNVTQVIEQIDARGPYWLDMESGVRTDDHFDLSKCRQVCEAVYGVRTA